MHAERIGMFVQKDRKVGTVWHGKPLFGTDFFGIMPLYRKERRCKICMILPSEAEPSLQMDVKGNRWRGRNPEILFRTGKILQAVEDYILACGGEREEAGSAGSRVRNVRTVGGKFPNLAGFGRYLGRGLEELTALGEAYPAAYDGVMTALEDAALNAGSIPAGSAMLTMAYFRRRLRYGKSETVEGVREGDGEIRVMFDHNMEEDGK